MHLSPRLALALSLSLTAALAASGLAACAAGSGGNTFTNTGGTATGGGGATNTVTGTGGTGGDTITIPDGGTGGSAPLTFVAYAHTGKTLYKFDPNAVNTTPQLVGDFDNTDGSMFDIAVNKAGEIWGVTAANAYHIQIQGGVVKCGTPIPIGDGTGKVRFYGLTFAPDGWIGSGEALIAGNTAGELWSIDTTTGSVTQHGTFGKVPNTDGNGHTYKNAGKAWELSGDIVFLANSGKPVGFATVRDCPNPPSTTGCNLTDTLIQIDMTKLKSGGTQSVTQSVRGQITESPNCTVHAADDTHYQQLLGIAAWNDKVYGFSQSGSIVEIDNSDGSACEVVSSALGWYGAGVTTVAPVIVPPA
jgi:hypothetical protein